MNLEELQTSLKQYRQQLGQVEFSLKASTDPEERTNLLSLENDLKQLIALTEENVKEISKETTSETPLDDEYASFMAEMAEVGAVENNSNSDPNEPVDNGIEEDFKCLQNMKCQAPYSRDSRGTTYHNALVCGVVSNPDEKFENVQVRIMFTNPIYSDMLPCPYFLESECKFTDDKCRFSHGEVVPLASLQEYNEPEFGKLRRGGRVLVKLETSKLWLVGTIKALLDKQLLTVRIQDNGQEVEVEYDQVFPLGEEDSTDDDDENEDNSTSIEEYNVVIQKSLTNEPTSQAIGEWEKHTKGIGSKLLHKMGYVIGTGLGARSDGRIEPVDAVLLPSGKSLDHCMELREKAGGDSNFFKVEKKLKQLQRRQEKRNQRVYEREQNKTDVFTFINNKLSAPSVSKNDKRETLKKDSNKDLNVNGLKVEEKIQKVERELGQLKESLTRHKDQTSLVHKNLLIKLREKEIEMEQLKTSELNIRNEQKLRKDKKKLCVF